MNKDSKKPTKSMKSLIIAGLFGTAMVAQGAFLISDNFGNHTINVNEAVGNTLKWLYCV